MPPKAVDQKRAALQMAQRVGEVRGDAERAAQANHVDVFGVIEQLDGAFQLLGGDLHRQLLQRLRVDHGEHVEDFRRFLRRDVVVGGGLAEQARALGIVRRLFHQMLTEYLLHFVEAAEAEGVGETDQRGGRHAGLCGDGGNGIESDAVTVIKM